MNQLIHVVSLRRSGHHAVINWMMNNAYPESSNGTIVHVNDLYQGSRSLSPPPGMSIKTFSRNVSVILNYEDQSLGRITQLPTVTHPEMVIPTESVKTIILLRDPYNTFASRYQRLRNAELQGVTIPLQKLPWSEVADLWKSCAKEYLGVTNYFSNKKPVNYNQWLSNKNYRDNLLYDLFGNEVNLDRGLDEVSQFGRGSSFNGLDYNGKASQMDLKNRWKHFAEDQQFLDLFQDMELIRLSEEIFGNSISSQELLSSLNREKE